MCVPEREASCPTSMSGSTSPDSRVDQDLATARRLIMFSNAGDDVALNAVMCEVQCSERGAKVLMALTVQAVTFGQHLYGPLFAEWIERAAPNQLDVAQADRRELDGE